MRDALLATQRKAVDIRPPDKTHLSAQGHGLGDVGAAPDPGVEEDGVDDGRERGRASWPPARSPWLLTTIPWTPSSTD